MKKYLFLFALLLLLPQTSEAKLKIIVGAELNSVTDGVEVTTNSAPIATTTTQAHSGTYAFRITAGAGFQRQVIYTSDQAATGTIRVWYYPVARPNANTQFIRWSNAANTSQGNITMTTTGTLTLLKADGTQIGSASAALPLNAWSCIELQNDSIGKTLNARVNTSSFASGGNSATGTWARALWGNVTGAQTTNDGYFDDIEVTDGTSTFPGCGLTKFLTPNAAGDANAWTDTSGSAGTTNNYTLVSDNPPNDATTMVQSATLNAEDLYNFSNTGLNSYDIINHYGVGTRYANDTADATTDYKIEWLATSGGTKVQSAAITPNSVTWSSYGVQASKDDSFQLASSTTATGGSLTPTIMDSMQAGYTAALIGVFKNRITNIWVYVDYATGTAPVVTSSSTPQQIISFE